MFRSFRSYITMVGVLTISTIIVAITINSYTLSRQAAFSLAEKLINANTAHFIDSTSNIFNQAEKDLEMLALAMGGKGQTLNSKDVLSVLWRLGQLNNEYVSVYLSDINGNFIQISKEPNLRTRTINANSSNKARIIYRNPDYSIKANMEQKNSYKPLLRPWFTNTGNDKKAYWTNVYKFKSNQALGVTATYPVFNGSGIKTGVVAIDITMKGLSEKLSNQPLSKEGFSFVLDAKGNIIAMPSKMINYENDTRQVPTLENLDNELVSGIIEQHQLLEANDEVKIINYDGDEFFTKQVTLNIGEIKNWRIFVSVPESSVMSEVNELLSNTIILSIIFLIVGLYLMVQVAGQLSKPVGQLLTNSQYLRRFEFSKIKPIHSRFNEVKQVSEQFLAIKKTLLAYNKYVPTNLVSFMLKEKSEITLGGENKNVTFFTTQIAGFRQIATQLDSKQQADYILNFQSEVTRVLMHANAIIDHYSGDKIVAFWGGANEQKNAQINACNAALTCRDGLKQLNHHFLEQGLPVFNYRIGIHNGDAIVGNFGSPERMVYSAIGDNVVLTEKVEAVNKLAQTDITISQAMYDMVHNQFNLKCVDWLEFNGQKQKVYALLSSAEVALTTQEIALNKQLDDVVTLMMDGKSSDASKQLKQLQKKHSDDQVVTYLTAKCKA